MYDPIAYTYDADIHCRDCALERFGRAADGFIAGEDETGELPTDSEGNPVGVVAPWESVGGEDHDYEDGPYVAGCGTCGTIIEYQVSPDSLLYLYPISATAETIRAEWQEARLDAAHDEACELRAELAAIGADLETAIDYAERIGRASIDGDAREVRELLRDMAREIDSETAAQLARAN